MWPEDGNLSALTDAELASLEQELVAAFDADRDAAATDEDIAALSELSEHITTTRTEQSSRAEASAERQARIDELASSVHADVDAPIEGEGEGEEAPAEGEEAPAEETPAETPAEEPEAPAADSVRAAAAKPAKRTLAAVQKNAPAKTKPRVEAAGNVSLTAGADIPGVRAGAPITSARELANMMIARQNEMGIGNGDKVRVATFSTQLGDERHLGMNDNVMDKINALGQTPDTITAAGGLCAPVANVYSQTVLGGVDRPVRDALANFTADRGGIQFMPSPTLSSVSGASPASVGIITSAQQAAGTLKTCMTIPCPTPQTVLINAIYRCLEFDNMQARAWPEQVEAWTQLSLVWQARTAETMLLDGIAANSTSVRTAGLVGAGREIFARLGQAAAGYRSRNRMALNAPFRVLLPVWVLDLVREDLVRTLPSDLSTFAVANSVIEGFLAARGLNVTWYLDSKTGGNQIWGPAIGGQTYTDFVTNGTTTVTSATALFTSADVGRSITAAGIPASATIASVTNGTTVVLTQAATTNATGVTGIINRPVLVQFPTTVLAYLYPEGTFLHLDGGELNIGLVRDSTLNNRNKYQIFAESFENVAKLGQESLEIVMSLTPDGSYGAAKTIASPINI